MKILLDSVNKVAGDVLRVCGVTEESRKVILDSMNYADRRGLVSHGVGRLPLYVKKIKAGHFNPKDEVETIIDFEAIATLDAHNGFGQVSAKKAVDMGISKAKKSGIAAVAVRNSNNFGTAGFFGRMIAEQQMAGLIFTNAAPAMAPAGGVKPILGTNPICFSFPAGKGEPIVFDMSTSVVARGKIRLAKKNGEKIPLTWATDKNGIPTDDPEVALNGLLQPVGGVKGYGLSLFVDLLAGMLSGACYGGKVFPLSDMDRASGNGHLFIIVDVARFISQDNLDEIVRDYKEIIQSCGSDGSVYLPGELGTERMKKHETYIELSEKQVEEINAVASQCQVFDRLEEYTDEE